jgi:DNA polymerase-3 subunit delta'
LAADICKMLLGSAPDPLKHTDVHTVEPESKSRRIVTEQVRDLERQLQMKSSLGGRKVGVIFDADRLQPQASNAFLKTLEEPPSHSYLILVTAFPDQLLETILSRCIEIPVKATSKLELTPTQESLLGVLGDCTKRGKGDLPHVFSLVRDFQRLLAEAKEAAHSQGEKELKTEEQRYKNIADSKWLEDREDYYKALTEARYIGERARLLDTLEQWWADVLRQQAVGVGDEGEYADTMAKVNLDFPTYARETALLATRYQPYDALGRAGALETLRDQLRNPGINEQLAIEVAFLKAFGDR